MKVITKMELKPGMELGEDLFSNGKIIYKKGTIMDTSIISKIARYDVLCVSIMEAVDYAKTHNEKIQFDAGFQQFTKVYNDCLMKYKGVMLSYLGTKQSIESSVLMGIFEECFSLIKTEKLLLDYLYNMMPNEDELTYSQGFNAALFCGAIANWLSLPEDERKLLILTGFYYDIGKWSLPNEILWKNTKLTDEEFALVKKHPVLGYSIVRNDHNLNEHIKNAVIMHHERFDGSGYPYRMSGEKIDLYARYISIADTYIAMASARAFRDAFTPFQILSNFEKSMDKYDVKLLIPIMRKIADAQIGTKVLLSDESEWEVMLLPQNSFSRPMLRNDENQILSLQDRPDLSIVKMI